MEGGAIICHDVETKKRIDYLKNFGFAGEITVMAPGINSKMNEMQAALGLLQLKHHSDNIQKRKEINNIYRQELSGIKGISFVRSSSNCLRKQIFLILNIMVQSLSTQRVPLPLRIVERSRRPSAYFKVYSQRWV